MKDELYVFRQDVREKSQTARSSHNKRTHTGKGGRVKFPSDYMTKKEKEAMNGEVKSYRLNEPMTWKEFKAMPDDIKVTYVKLLRERFDCFDGAIAEMMGVNKCTFSLEVKRLGIGHGAKHGGNRIWSEKDAFYAWRSGAKGAEPAVEDPVTEAAEQPMVEIHVEEMAQEDQQPANTEETGEPTPAIERQKQKDDLRFATPCTGSMVYEGEIKEVLNSIYCLLGGNKVHISVTWDVLEDEEDG